MNICGNTISIPVSNNELVQTIHMNKKAFNAPAKQMHADILLYYLAWKDTEYFYLLLSQAHY